MSIWRDGGLDLVARRCRQIALRKMHENFIERLLHLDEVHSTSGTQSLGDLSTVGGNKLSGSFYDPTPRLVLRGILNEFAVDRAGWNFVDVGTGRGRVVLEAARHRFRKVIGIEFAQELFAKAEKNISALGACEKEPRHVEVHHCDATEWTAPSGPTIYFLYNPFDADVLEKFLKHTLTYKGSGSTDMIFLYLNPEEDHVFQREPRLQSKPISRKLALKLATLSPYTLSVYSTFSDQ